MPTYEYECKKCGNLFEVFQKMTDKPIKSCPKCKGQVRRLIGAGSGIIFKGSGFYATDYKKSKPGQGHKNNPEQQKQQGCPQAGDGKDSPCKNCPSGQGEKKD